VRVLVVDVLVVAARVVPPVDHRVTAAVGVRAVNLLDDRQRAALVSAVVDDLRAAARRVPAPLAVLHLAVAADGAPIVVDRRVAAAAVLVVGPRSNHASAADVRLVVVDVIAAAAGTAAVRLAAQFATTADVLISIIHQPVATAVRLGPAR